MLEVVEENKNVKILKVSMPHEVIEDARDEVYDEISKDIKIKGFRPGMAPRNLINSIIGMDKINEMIKEKVADEAYDVIIEEYLKTPQGDDVILPPRLKSVELGGNAEVTFEIHLFPKVEIESMDKIEITIPKLHNDSEKMINDSIEDLRKEKAILIPKDGNIEIGDQVEIEYQDLTGKDPEKKELELKVAKPEEGNIFSHLVGKKAGDEFDFSTTAENSGNVTHLHVKILKVYSVKLPEIDDNFAKMVDDKYETLEDLKNNLRSQIDKVMNGFTESLKIDVVLNELVKKTKLDVLDSTIDYFVDYVVDKKKEEKTYDKELKEKFNGDEKAFKDSIREEVINYMKLEGAIKSIAKEKSLDVSDEEIFEEARETYEKSKISDERLKVMLKKDSDLYQSIKRNLMSDKVARELLKNAVVKEEEVGKDSQGEIEEDENESEGSN
ncbi:trigger factor [Athalassotoga saccharophila]|uniref:trigger factor n=1 Tax=Athalassotoga saccharophila TaxID=1441386 RepID=UPI00137A7181|nr:trigger factor [Athalassotoga saccharophila]BBJ27643.1 cell division trigger factor [Athalassotoga saccharophila]